MSSNLVALRTAIVTTLAADSRLQGVNIYPHGGDFDLAELKAYGKKSAAVFVAIMHAESAQLGGIPRACASVAMVVLTKDQPTSRRDIAALNVVEALLNILTRAPNQRWGLDASFGLSNVSDVRSDNFYSRKLDNEGVALWGVAFKQTIGLAYTDSSEAFNTLAANWDLYPRDNDAPIGVPGDEQPDDAVIDAQDLIELP